MIKYIKSVKYLLKCISIQKRVLIIKVEIIEKKEDAIAMSLIAFKTIKYVN